MVIYSLEDWMQHILAGIALNVFYLLARRFRYDDKIRTTAKEKLDQYALSINSLVAVRHPEYRKHLQNLRWFGDTDRSNPQDSRFHEAHVAIGSDISRDVHQKKNRPAASNYSSIDEVHSSTGPIGFANKRRFEQKKIWKIYQKLYVKNWDRKSCMLAVAFQLSLLFYGSYTTELQMENPFYLQWAQVADWSVGTLVDRLGSLLLLFAIIFANVVPVIMISLGEWFRRSALKKIDRADEILSLERKSDLNDATGNSTKKQVALLQAEANVANELALHNQELNPTDHMDTKLERSRKKKSKRNKSRSERARQKRLKENKVSELNIPKNKKKRDLISQ